jgi:hypothetical protein
VLSLVRSYELQLVGAHGSSFRGGGSRVIVADGSEEAKRRGVGTANGLGQDSQDEQD